MNPTPTPLASTAMDAARECADPIPCGYDVFGSIVRYRQPTEDDISAIIQKHFQPLLAKVEGAVNTLNERIECDAMEIGTLMQENTGLRADLAAAKATCAELVTDGNAITLAASLAKKSVECSQLKADLAAKETALKQAERRFSRIACGELSGMAAKHCAKSGEGEMSAALKASTLTT